jgi:8-oxo-dGTP diphosphatase
MDDINVMPNTVAVGILINTQGYCLLSTRPEGKSYAGYWEFPGGKIEPHEELFDALKRELKEEINITVSYAKLWLVKQFVYSSVAVHLHFFLVEYWKGDILAKEGQILSWQNPHSPTVSPILAANLDVLDQLTQQKRITSCF